MKSAELFEYRHRRKSEEERDALKNASDYWRLQLRKEMTKFNQQFGIVLRRSEPFDRYSDNVAKLGGEYNFLVSGADSLSFPKEKRFELWKKAYAKKIHELVQKGYEVWLEMRLESSKVKPTDSVEDILYDLNRQLRPLGDHPQRPLVVNYKIYVKKPDEAKSAA